MKRLYKILLTVFAAISFSFVSIPSHALIGEFINLIKDAIMDGAENAELAALLAQQEAQYIQDDLLGADQRDATRKSLESVRTVIKILNPNNPMYQQLFRVARTEEAFFQTVESLENYLEYGKKYGNYKDLQRLNSYAQRFQRTGSAALSALEDAVKFFANLFDGNADIEGLISSIEETNEDTNKELSDEAAIAQMEMARECVLIASRDNLKKDRDLLKWF